MDRNSVNVDLKSLIIPYLKNWKWFILTVIIALAIAYTQLRYAIPQYEASAKILIIKEGSSTSELSVLKDLDLFSNGNANAEITDEIEILESRSNYYEVIKNLNLNINYSIPGKIKDTEIYGENYPFSINFVSPDSISNKSRHEFIIEAFSETKYRYKEEEEEEDFKTYDFGIPIKTKIGEIILVPNNGVLNTYYNKTLKIAITPVPLLIDYYKEETIVEPIGESSDIITISLNDTKTQRAIDIINELIRINNINAVTDKKAIADKTSQFIEDRITEIYTNLSSVDKTAESYKTSRGIADLGSQSSVNFQQSAAGQQELQNASIQLKVASSMQELITGQSSFDIIPEVGLADQGVSNAAQRYNILVGQRNRLLKTSNEKNPVIVNIDKQLNDLQKGMQSSLNNITNNLNLQVNSLSKQLSQINSQIYAAPGKERALRDITRKQQTTESLYLYLLQKREESQITFASASPKSKVIDSAHSSYIPVSPKSKMIYLTAFIFGLLIPFSFIYVKNLLDNKIHNKIGLEEIIGSNYPVLAEIPKLGKKENKLVSRIDRSVFGESLRILRTNLDYILKKDESNAKGKIILVTSSVPAEGKTLLSSNLTMIFASTKKKVLLVGADIRNPKLYNFYEDLKKSDSKTMNRQDFNGLTEYLYNKDIEFKDIVKSMSVNENNIDVIYSGKIPPNPSELLMSKRLKRLFEEAKNNYDYIIVDSAPLLVVTDTLLISNNADQIIYVTKAGFTDEKVINYPIQLANEGKIKNLSFVVNNVKSAELGYGGKYGYGYGKKVKKWWQLSVKG